MTDVAAEEKGHNREGLCFSVGVNSQLIFHFQSFYPKKNQSQLQHTADLKKLRVKTRILKVSLLLA